MRGNLTGYPFRLADILTRKNDGACVRIYIYTFRNSRNTQYIVNVEEYANSIFIVKFHTKSHRQSKFRYNILTGEKIARPIIFTCIQIGQKLIESNPLASFGFIGAPTMQEKNKVNKEDVFKLTKRFNVYKKFAVFFFDPKNYLHKPNPELSSYLLLNKQHLEINPNLESDIIKMFDQHFDFNQIYN